MAHIANRSRFRVTVKNKPEATRYFSFNKLAEVEAYMKALRAQRLTPKAAHLDESWLVRVRDQGHKPLEATFALEAAAPSSANVIAAPPTLQAQAPDQTAAATGASRATTGAPPKPASSGAMPTPEHGPTLVTDRAFGEPFLKARCAPWVLIGRSC